MIVGQFSTGYLTGDLPDSSDTLVDATNFLILLSVCEPLSKLKKVASLKFMYSHQ